MMRIIPQKIMGAGLSVILTAQIALGSVAESNFWAERQKIPANKADDSFSEFSTQLASLPPSLVNSQSLLKQLPAIKTTLPTAPNEGFANKKLSASFSKPFQALMASIPLTQVTIQDVYDSGDKNAPPVVIIQDVHLNAEAQTRIAAVLQELMNNNMADLVGVEGAFDRFDFSRFRSFSDPVTTRKISNDFLQKNWLAAPSYAGITAVVEPPTFVGVDDEPSYRKNVAAYRQSFEGKDRVVRELAKLELISSTAKEKTLSRQLQTFDTLRSRARNNNIGFGAYVKSLAAYDVSRDFVIEQFLAAYEMESTLNFQKVDEERRIILEKLTKVLNKTDLSNLLNQSLAYRMGRVSFGVYYQYLKDLCEINGISLRSYPAFDGYIRYVLLCDGIKADRLFTSIDALEQQIIHRLTTNKIERELLASSEWVNLTRKLLNFSLSPTEWRKYKRLQVRFLSHEFRQLSLAPYQHFYEQADIRSRKMVENLFHYERETKISPHGSQLGDKQGHQFTKTPPKLPTVRGGEELSSLRSKVLIVGGFHTPDITEQLKSNQKSYLVVSPKITKVDELGGSSYLSAFAKEKTPLDKLFAGEKLFLAPEDRNITDSGRSAQLEDALRQAARPSILPSILRPHVIKRMGQSLWKTISRTGSSRNRQPLSALRVSVQKKNLFHLAPLWGTLMWLLSGIAAFGQNQNAATGYDPTTPIRTLDDAVQFVRHQLNPTNFPVVVRNNPLPGTFNVPPKTTGYFYNSVQKLFIDEAVVLYPMSLGIRALLKTGKPEDLAEAERMLKLYSEPIYGKDMKLRADAATFPPLQDNSTLLFNVTRKTGTWSSSWVFWDVGIGPNAWMLNTIGDYIQTKHKRGETPDGDIVLLGDTLARGMLLLRTPEGLFRWGPKIKQGASVSTTNWDTISLENQASVYMAFMNWAKAKKDDSFRVVANQIWEGLNTISLLVPKSGGGYAEQIGFFHRGIDGTYFFVGANYASKVVNTHFATDTVTWTIPAFGPELINQTYGNGTTDEMITTVRQFSGVTPTFDRAELTGELAGYDFSNTLRGDPLTGTPLTKATTLLNAEWSGTAHLVVNADFDLRAAMDQSPPNLEFVAGQVQDYLSIEENRTGNGTDGPGLNAPRNGGTTLDWEVPRKPTVSDMATVLTVMAPFTEARETISVNVPQGFARFMVTQLSQLRQMRALVHYSFETQNGSISQTAKDGAGNTVFTSAVNDGPSVALKAFVKTPLGEMTQQQSFLFSPNETKITISAQGQSNTWTSNIPNPLDHGGGMFVSQGTNGLVTISVALPPATESEIRTHFGPSIDQGPIKIGLKGSPALNGAASQINGQAQPPSVVQSRFIPPNSLLSYFFPHNKKFQYASMAAEILLITSAIMWEQFFNGVHGAGFISIIGLWVAHLVAWTSVWVYSRITGKPAPHLPLLRNSLLSHTALFGLYAVVYHYAVSMGFLSLMWLIYPIIIHVILDFVVISLLKSQVESTGENGEGAHSANSLLSTPLLNFLTSGLRHLFPFRVVIEEFSLGLPNGPYLKIPVPIISIWQKNQTSEFINKTNVVKGSGGPMRMRGHRNKSIVGLFASTSKEEEDDEEAPSEDDEDHNEPKGKILDSSMLRLYEADYGFLDNNHVAVQYVRNRARVILPDVPEQDLPEIKVLAKRGAGVNAMAFENGTIVITPEMLELLRYDAETDALLLHEFNHIARNHHQKLALTFMKSLTGFIGELRYSEWESDAIAMYQMSEPKRKTNPKGAISLLERLRRQEYWQEGSVSWDLAHGDITDRIINLKSGTHLVDLLKIEREMTFIDKQIAASLEPLKKGGELLSILEVPDDIRKFFNWKRRGEKTIEEMSMAQLLTILKPMFTMHQEATPRKWQSSLQFETGKQEVFSSFLKAFDKRFENLFKQQYPSRSLEEVHARAILRIILLECSAGIDVISNSNKISQTTNFVSSVVAKAHDDYLAFSEFGSQKQKTVLQRFSETFERIGSGNRIDEIGTEFFLAKLIEDQISAQAAYDTAEGVDIARFLAESNQLIHAAAAAIKALRPSRTKNLPWAESWAWTYAVVTGALTLSDLGQWDEWKDRYENEVRIGSTFPLDRDTARLALRKAELSSRDDVNEIRPVMDSLFDIHYVMGPDIPKYLERLKNILKIFDENPVLDIYQKDKFDTLKKLKEAAEIINTFQHPDLQKERQNAIKIINNSFAIFDPEGHGMDIPDEITILFIHWNHVVQDQRGFEYAMQKFSMAYGNHDKPLKPNRSYPSLLKIADAVTDFKAAEKLFGIKPSFSKTLFRLENEFIFQIIAALRFEHHLKHLNSADVFAETDLFVQRWPWKPPIKPEKWESSFEYGQRFKAVRARTSIVSFLVKRLKETITQLEEKNKLRHLLICSFLIDDSSIARPLQEYALEELVKKLPLKGALNLLMRTYEAQTLFVSTNLLENLDDKAETQEDLEFLAAEGEKWLTKPTTRSYLGLDVLGELKSTQLNPKARADLFFALMGTETDDEELRELLGEAWFRHFGPDVREAIQYANSSEEVSSVKLFIEETIKRYWFNALLINAAPENALQFLYRMRSLDRHFMLRKLLADDRGVFAIPSSREMLHRRFFKEIINTGSDLKFKTVIEDIFRVLLEVVPRDELYLILEPLLETHIANPPTQSGSWEETAKHIAKKDLLRVLPILDGAIISARYEAKQAKAEDKGNLDVEDDSADEEFDLDDWLPHDVENYKEEYLENSRRHVGQIIYQQILSSLMNGHAPISKASKDILGFVPSVYWKRESKSFTPIELTLHAARRLGAPGIRFLQLLGQAIEIPSQYRQDFLSVYDDIRGQSKVNAWRTITRELPEYAQNIERLSKRLGGGSLFTIYAVWLKDGRHDPDEPDEVVKVLNPNALYHTRQSVELMKETLEALAEKDSMYQQALPLVDLLEEWIEKELQDATFDADDKAFREKWQGWKPDREWTKKVVVPVSIPTGSRFVHREQYIPGKDFKSLSNNEEDRELVALAVQNYLAQIKGNTWSNFLSLVGVGKQEEVLVLSDLSPGNFRKTKDGNLALLDRGMYLKLGVEERKFLKELYEAPTSVRRIEIFVEWACEISRKNKEGTSGSWNSTIITEEILEDIRNKENSDDEDITLDILQHVHKHGLHIPLKFILLFKNFNYLNRLSIQVGFPKGMRQAAVYPKDKPIPTTALPPSALMEKGSDLDIRHSIDPKAPSEAPPQEDEDAPPALSFLRQFFLSRALARGEKAETYLASREAKLATILGGAMEALVFGGLGVISALPMDAMTFSLLSVLRIVAVGALYFAEYLQTQKNGQRAPPLWYVGIAALYAFLPFAAFLPLGPHTSFFPSDPFWLAFLLMSLIGVLHMGLDARMALGKPLTYFTHLSVNEIVFHDRSNTNLAEENFLIKKILSEKQNGRISDYDAIILAMEFPEEGRELLLKALGSSSQSWKDDLNKLIGTGQPSNLPHYLKSEGFTNEMEFLLKQTQKLLILERLKTAFIVSIYNTKEFIQRFFGRKSTRHQRVPKLRQDQIRNGSPKYHRLGGWKLHLVVDPSNYERVHQWLWTNTEEGYKHLHGGEPGEKDFTVYVGEKDKADKLAHRISTELESVLLPAGKDIKLTDVELAKKVWGRFDANDTISGIGRYGNFGIPFYGRDSVARTYWFIEMSNTHGPHKSRLQTMIQLMDFIHAERAFNTLRNARGFYFTGGAKEKGSKKGSDRDIRHSVPDMQDGAKWLAGIGAAFMNGNVDNLLAPSRSLGVGGKFDTSTSDAVFLANLNQWVDNPKFQNLLTKALQIRLAASDKSMTAVELGKKADEVAQVVLAYAVASSRGLSTNPHQVAAFVVNDRTVESDTDRPQQLMALMASLIQYNGTGGAGQILFIQKESRELVEEAIGTLKTWGWASIVEIVTMDGEISSFQAIADKANGAFVLVHPSDFDSSEAPRTISKVDFDKEFLIPIRSLGLNDIIKVLRTALIAA